MLYLIFAFLLLQTKTLEISIADIQKAAETAQMMYQVAIGALSTALSVLWYKLVRTERSLIECYKNQVSDDKYDKMVKMMQQKSKQKPNKFDLEDEDY